jgi:cysteinyl-tRNA synthetase
MDSGDFHEGNLETARPLMERFDSIFDVLRPTVRRGEINDEEIEVLIAERGNARKSKNFKRSDEIRNQLLERGVILEDTKEGMRWKRK